MMAGRAQPLAPQCESASNLDATPIEHHIVEAEPEFFISGVLDRRPTGTPSFVSTLPPVHNRLEGHLAFAAKKDESIPVSASCAVHL
jgi:hypothetical protein